MPKTKPKVLSGSTLLIRQVCDVVQSSREYVVKQTNSIIVLTYFHIGKLIVDFEQHGNTKAIYGKATIKRLSAKLTKQFGNGFSERNIEQMRSFFILYQERTKRMSIPQTASAEFELGKTLNSAQKRAGQGPKPQTLSAESLKQLFPLSWSHYVILTRIQNEDERSFYEIESVNNNWGVRELQRQLDSSLFERLTLSKNKKKVRELATKGQIITKPEDVIKAPYVLEFLGLDEKAIYTETELESAIIARIESFLLELGKGFLFQGRQVKFILDDDHYYVDLVLYNRLLKCFVLIDLKIGKLRHQDLGQMQMYVNYYDRYIKSQEENSSIGIIICKDKSDAMVEITLPKEQKQIFAADYRLYLPTKAALRKVVTE